MVGNNYVYKKLQMYHILQNKMVTALTHEKHSSPQECAHFSTHGNVAFSPLEKSYFSCHRPLGIVILARKSAFF
jgi:hypothetical protein